MTTGRKAIFGMGKPTETIGIEQPAHGHVARHGHAEHDAGARRDQEADEGPIERDAPC